MLNIKYLSRRLSWVPFLLCAISPAFAENLKTLHGHVPEIIADLSPKGRVPATQELRLAIGLPLRNTVALDQFITRLYDPASPGFHQYLTQDQFNARFGPTPEDYESVKNFARTNGLAIAATSVNRLLLDVTGPAAFIEKAFHLKLQTYRHPAGNRDFFAPDSEPTVDAALPVVDIQGLSNVDRPHPKFVLRNSAKLDSKIGSSPDGLGTFFGNDFRNAFAPGTTLTGAGQSVALYEADGFFANDIANYANAAGNGRANISIQTVLLDGFSGTPTTGEDSGNPEVSLDIEMAMAMAPGLTSIIVVEGNPNNYIPNDILNGMLSYNATAKNLSCSWGWTGGPSITTDDIFTNMAAMGQSFFNASGDSDAFTAGATSSFGVDNTRKAFAPSSCPIITQVGGTFLGMNGTAASYSLEAVWNVGLAFGSGYNGEGSSGGVSSFYSIPSWQATVPNLAARGGSASFRNIPDVAMPASDIFVALEDGESGDIGGTSCAAPLWAGFMALVNQQAAANSKPAAGFVNPALYSLAATSNYNAYFHDVTIGNNAWSKSPGAFVAMPGYDLCTGLGSPGGQSLINALAGTQTLIFSSATGFFSSGPAGGPFSVTSQNYSVINAAAGSLSWGIANSASWLNVSPSGGTLSSGAQTNITVSLAATANNLSAGIYPANLLLTNSSGLAAVLPFTLSVGQSLVTNGGFETDGFLGWTLTSASTNLNQVSPSPTYTHSGGYGAILGQDPSLGYLSQTLATISNRNYLLSFWLANPENSAGATPNQFLAQWNGTNVFNQTNIPFITWTNVQLFVTASSSNTVLQFGFEDTPEVLALDDVSVVPISPPMLATAQLSGSSVNLTWSTIPNLSYQLQYETNLLQFNWINLGGPQVASGNTLSFTDTGALSSSARRFYRVLLQP